MAIEIKRNIQWIREEKKGEPKKHKYAGLHLLAEFWDGKIIDDADKIKSLLVEAVKRAKNTPLEFVVHKFEPQGVTGIVLLAESHISIHTWPEFNYVALDIYTCGDKSSPRKALEYLKSEFNPKRSEISEIKRGKM
ncbi:MAG: adenosylmethionine decarboxylase [Candidatus Nealsonbacteria bacterium]|nr:adenosylmethionine decarboxylase [Candidatus Nealsonbacteria bacterium]